MYIKAASQKYGQFADMISPPLLLSSFPSSIRVKLKKEVLFSDNFIDSGKRNRY